MTLLPEFHDQLHAAARRRARRGSLTPLGSLIRVGRVAPVLLSTLVAVTVVVVAVALLSHDRAPRGPAAPAPESSRQELIQTLGVLRAPQTPEDRLYLLAQNEPVVLRLPKRQVCRVRTTPLPAPCAETLDRPLVRRVALPGLGYQVGLFPVASRPTASLPTGGEGLLITLSGPKIDRLTSEGELPDAAALRSHGLLLSTNVGNSINRGAVIVPDGVAKVVLRGFTLLKPRHASASAVTSTSAPVRSNVALFQLDHVTLGTLHLNPARLGRYFTQGSGTRCTLRYVVFAIPASAQMVWLDSAGATVRTQTIQLSLFVSTHHPPRDLLPQWEGPARKC